MLVAACVALIVIGVAVGVVVSLLNPDSGPGALWRWLGYALIGVGIGGLSLLYLRHSPARQDIDDAPQDKK